ncbi:UDP-glucose dehydrogenase family protein [Alteribacter keqinensis]|uniref:UDP-glucose 6-dehydrogenase n=1 Tax=Alteribacter keqinensis TaxID=2483800 RepID=A0A3M7TQM0_9BACI|nr:UDP-glucose/GDP-mannose dehydrogenase family protein [Alteribacter keqinensis]RNA67469.1 UDP-glucose/GDP-mannose dehydrogenase family protein [Alteribacter keqinensis]
MKAAVAGTGYVGLFTGVILSELGHSVICIDTDRGKVALMDMGQPPIHEPGLAPMMKKNLEAGRLCFTTDYEEGCKGADAIFIAVGTPEDKNGRADLRFVREACMSIGRAVTSDVTVVTKSTVPVGTNDLIKDWINFELRDSSFEASVVSNPEFLRQGSAVHDSLYADRVIIGADDQNAGDLVEALYFPLNLPVIRTDIRSAEMIKYASNAFLAMKISFINEIAQLSERIGADVEEVAAGMGKDERIGSRFLQAGIGYGGSCFPKDTKALKGMAGDMGYSFKLLDAVEQVNMQQQTVLVEKALNRFGSVDGLRVTVLGLSFKPNTDDMREAPSVVIINQLLALGAHVSAYDPAAAAKAKNILPSSVRLVHELELSLYNSDFVFLVTDWAEFKRMDLRKVKWYTKQGILFDGRNIFSSEEARQAGIEYHSIGRPVIYPQIVRGQTPHNL